MSLPFSSLGKNICTAPASISRHTTCHPFKKVIHLFIRTVRWLFTPAWLSACLIRTTAAPLHVLDNLCFPFLNSKIKISPFIPGTRLPRFIIYILALICIFHLIILPFPPFIFSSEQAPLAFCTLYKIINMYLLCQKFVDKVFYLFVFL